MVDDCQEWKFENSLTMAFASSKQGVLVFLVFCLSITTACVNSHKQVALFVFGDSLFDPGNNNYINTGTVNQPSKWPYGISYFNPPSGRFSDGRLIPDFIAEYAKLPLIPAYLEPGNNEFAYGANFASGGAGALTETYAGLVIDLHTQLRYFGDLEERFRKNLGDMKTSSLLSDAVYLFSCGANDYLSPVGNNHTIYHPYTHEQYMNMVIGNLTNVIKVIYEKGGRKFGFVNVPSVGCWPGIRIRQPGYTCSKEMDDIIGLHNQALVEKLEIFEEQLEGFAYAIFDLSTSITNRMKNPSRYGFKGETACCGSGPFRGFYNCGGTKEVEEYEVCDNATEYLFFDAFHPNELASHQLAELLWDGDSKTTGPYNLKALFEGKPRTQFVPNDEL